MSVIRNHPAMMMIAGIVSSSPVHRACSTSHRLMALSFQQSNRRLIASIHALLPKPSSHPQARTSPLPVNAHSTIAQPTASRCRIVIASLARRPAPRPKVGIPRLLHELTHWSGAETSSARAPSVNALAMMPTRWKKWLPSLALRSSVVILASRQNHAPDHADYIGHWLRILKGDRKAIFTAASAANKASEYLANLSNRERREAA